MYALDRLLSGLPEFRCVLAELDDETAVRKRSLVTLLLYLAGVRARPGGGAAPPVGKLQTWKWTELLACQVIRPSDPTSIG